jgi:hypothetical protein
MGMTTNGKLMMEGMRNQSKSKIVDLEKVEKLDTLTNGMRIRTLFRLPKLYRYD